MFIGDRFYKDGKLVEVVAINPWGYSYKTVKEEVFKPTIEPTVEKEEAPAVFPAEEKEPEKEKKAVVRRTRKKA